MEIADLEIAGFLDCCCRTNGLETRCEEIADLVIAGFLDWSTCTTGLKNPEEHSGTKSETSYS